MGIADFLISRRQQRLLAPLLTQPHRSFSLSELLRLSGAGRGAYEVTTTVAAGDRVSRDTTTFTVN